MFVLLFLHIATMIAAVTVAYGSGFVMRLAYGTGQVAPIRGVAAASGPIGILIPLLFVSGGIFGLLTAITFGYSLLAPWLLIAYGLWLAAMLIGVAVNRPFAMQLRALLATVPDGPISGPIEKLFAAPRVRAFTAVDYLIILALIFDMVVKPFS